MYFNSDLMYCIRQKNSIFVIKIDNYIDVNIRHNGLKKIFYVLIPLCSLYQRMQVYLILINVNIANVMDLKIYI